MSLYNDASLVMIPSAYKDGKLYSIKPTDGSGDFTFSRGSNLAATRVDENGLIEKGRENFLLQSNQFDTTWTLSVVSVISGQSGYDGSNNAWLLNSTTTGFPRIEQSVTLSGVSTFSVYAKAATDEFILMRTFGADSSVWFDLNNALIPNISGSQYISSKIESIGNGWYRCSVTFNGSLTSLRVYPASSVGTYSTSGNGVYIQDAQLEYGLVATDYIETTTTTAQAGILEDMPRLDYSGSCPSLLLEPQRTNLAPHSEFIDSSWNPYGNISITHNSATSPEGVQNAAEISAAATTTAAIGIQDPFTVSAGTEYTISFFAKKGDFRYIQLFHGSGQVTLNARTNFDIQEGVVAYEESGVVTASVKDYGNGWYRCSATMEALLTTLQAYIAVAPTADAARSPSISATAGENYYLYGIQVEEGYLTSYIPCYGAATTRSSENMLDLTLNYGNTFSALFDLSGLGGSTSNNFIIRLGSTNSIYLSVRKSDKKLQFYSPAAGYFATTATQKIAISCDGTNWIWSSDGASGTLTATGSNNAEYIKIRTDGGAGGGLPSALVNQIALFDTALTADELNSLTS